MPYEINRPILGNNFVNPCDAGKSIVPKTSRTIAEKSITYRFILKFSDG